MVRVKNSGDNGDRISSLPDCVLHLIMSFLTARQAIQLCIVSKRWKKLWTTLPALFFTILDFQKRNSWHQLCDLRMDDIETFWSFMNTALLLRDKASLLHTFRLHCPCYEGIFFLTVLRWIRIVLQHNIQVIQINLNADTGAGGYPYMFQKPINADPTTSPLPPCLFTCQTLENLSLTFNYRLTPSTVNLPTLRRLHLGNMHVSQNIMDKILCGSPMLEDLHLQSMYELSSITSHSLKYLEIKNICGYLQDVDENEVPIVVINTPNLRCFHYGGCPYYFYNNLHWNMPSIDDVSIAIICDCDEYCYAESDVLCGVLNARYIELKGGIPIMGLLEIELHKCPNFLNLRSLLVDSFCFCFVDILASFSGNFPVLKKLSLDLLCWPICCDDGRRDHGAKTIEISKLRCKRLKQIEFKYDRRDKEIEQTIDHLLKLLLDGAQLREVEIIMTRKEF